MPGVTSWSLADGNRLARTVGPHLRDRVHYTSEEFIEAAEIALQEHPDEWAIYYQLGDHFQALGRHADSVVACAKCVELRPSDLRSAYALATAYRMVADDTKNPQASEVAQTELGVTEPEAAAEALTWFRRCLDLKPDIVALKHLQNCIMVISTHYALDDDTDAVYDVSADAAAAFPKAGLRPKLGCIPVLIIGAVVVAIVYPLLGSFTQPPPPSSLDPTTQPTRSGQIQSNDTVITLTAPGEWLVFRDDPGLLRLSSRRSGIQYLAELKWQRKPWHVREIRPEAFLEAFKKVLSSGDEVVNWGDCQVVDVRALCGEVKMSQPASRDAVIFFDSGEYGLSIYLNRPGPEPLSDEDWSLAKQLVASVSLDQNQ